MKLINKLMAMAIALLAMVAVSACSSYEDPDVAFKGKVNANFLNALSRGETSVTFKIEKVHSYEKEYNKNSLNGDKWTEITGKYDIDGINIIPDRFSIYQGRTWITVELSDLIPEECLLAGAWNIYCKKTKFNKDIFVADKVEFNQDNKTLKLNGTVFEVESANEDKLIISNLSETYSIKSSELKPSHLSKTIIILKKNAIEIPETGHILSYESRNEAMLAMVRMIRAEYGDVLNLGSNYTFPHINLAQIEENILNDCIGQGIGKLNW